MNMNAESTLKTETSPLAACDYTMFRTRTGSKTHIAINGFSRALCGASGGRIGKPLSLSEAVIKATCDACK